MKVNKARKYIPFGYKLMLSYSLFIIIPVLLVGYIANSVFVESMRKQTRTNIQGTLQQMKDNVQYKMENIQRISDMLYFDDKLAAHLHHYEMGWVNYEATKKYMLPKFRTAIETTTSKVWLSFYFHNETFNEIYSLWGSSDPLLRNPQVLEWYHIKRINEKIWYRQFPPENYGLTMQWRKIEDDDRYGRISLLRRVVDISQADMKEIGFLRISVYLSELFESLDFQKIGEGTTLLVTDNEQRIVISSGLPGWKSGDTWTGANPKEHLVIQQALPELNWNLVALVPTKLTDTDTDKIRTLTFIICLACFAIFSIAGFFISRFFSKRVSKIVSVLDSFQEGEFHKRILFKGNDEFTRISLALNDMGHNIGGLIREVYVTNLRKTEAELETLQAQINPHFLFNTLSSISRLAKFGDVDTQHLMVMNLAKFYRLSLNDGRANISILKELELIQAYLDIQQVKFGERMQVQTDISVGIIHFDTLKLILQPFVENCLKHAWCGDRIHIRITGTLERELIVFRIIDDGVGMSSPIVARLFEGTEDAKAGYGIHNVNERIKLYYGHQYGVKIHSKKGIGTTVQIEIPAIRYSDKKKTKIS
ncbi:sensor histidine kinase [Cohnella mopanensis]|uniref:sensor histidine kinase n=1 Tax=Cohnella mopanensis TaxID=2911966 RepID=UPI001EF8DFA7|nr:sensor histidine kinase [Cohnella mopanensis]